jgi:CRP/FNR family transcriptional regulator, cyclic AMP receptor protein
MTEQDTELARSAIFGNLSAAELELVSAAARPVRFAAGERVFSEGNPARGCWLIHGGCIALDLMIPGRGRVVVQTLGPGDVLGWSWLLPPYEWHFGAAAVRPTTATELDTDQLRTLAEQDTRFGYVLALSLFQACVQRLQATRARLLDLYRSPNDQY